MNFSTPPTLAHEVLTPRPLPRKPDLPVTPQRVLVLKGGWSAERSVSLVSGAGVEEALQELGHRVEAFDPPRDPGQLINGIRGAFGGAGPEVVFNILHGREVEDGILQGILHLLGIPFTFSGVLASAMAMDKNICRQIVQSHGITCPRGQVMDRDAYHRDGWPTFPHVLKPLNEGSSVGVQLITNKSDQDQALETWLYGNRVLIEDYVGNREIPVAVLGGVAMGALELQFEGPLFSYENKYVEGKTCHLIPAPIPPRIYEQALQIAEKAHVALGCKGATRTDLRYDDTPHPDAPEGRLFFLELNSQPGMTPLSLIPDIARGVGGWRYAELVQWILDHAQEG